MPALHNLSLHVDDDTISFLPRYGPSYHTSRSLIPNASNPPNPFNPPTGISPVLTFKAHGRLSTLRTTECPHRPKIAAGSDPFPFFFGAGPSCHASFNIARLQ
ncbi:hypothetical protein QC760_001555 [Botrytis cinerea]